MSVPTKLIHERIRELALEINLLATESEEVGIPKSLDNPKLSEDHYHDSWWLLQARKLQHFRRLRGKYFPSYFFNEPAWNILIDLFIQDIQGRRVSVTSACIASETPGTTALRWITLMQEEGMIERQTSAKDRRRTWLLLTLGGKSRIKKYILATNNLSPPKSPELMLIQGGGAGD